MCSAEGNEKVSNHTKWFTDRFLCGIRSLDVTIFLVDVSGELTRKMICLQNGLF